MPISKQTKRTWRRPIETGGFLLLRGIVPFMPRVAVVGLSRMVGRIAMRLSFREKRVGMKNIDAVFGDRKSEREKRDILQTSLATFCQTMLDVFWFSRNPAIRIGKYVSFEENSLKNKLFEDRPAICITAHLGSWEIMGQTCALMGCDLASIAATVKNRTVDRILVKHRERTGQTIIPQKGALKSLIARFRKNGKAAFVLDQITSEKEGGIVVDFLGLPMPVSPAPAALAYRTGTEIIFGFCLPRPGGRYHISITGNLVPPPFDKDTDPDRVALELTQTIQDKISEVILEHPQYWLWSYKHWRQGTGANYPENYPQY